MMLRLLAVVLALGTFLQLTSPAEALWTPDANECAMLGLVNSFRASYGLPPVALSRSLSMAADHHSQYMSETDDVDHTLGPISWSQNILDYGYPEGYAMGENVLAGRQSAKGAMALWRTSPGHLANMLNPAWTAIGIGRVYKPSGMYRFYWTQTFGSVRHRTISC